VQPNTADNAYDLGRIDLNTAASTLSAASTQADGNIQVLTPDADIVQNRMVFSTVNEEVRALKNADSQYGHWTFDDYRAELW